MDSEIQAIAKVSEALSELDPAAQKRVLLWAADRFDLQILDAKGPARNEGNGAEPPGGGDDPEEFASVADLFVAAAPLSQGERLLVAGYWLQEAESATDFTSYEANKLLKDLGHQIGSVNKVFDGLKDQSPQLVVQTGKSGGGAKGRKRHKLTKAGKDRVLEMIARGQGRDVR